MTTEADILREGPLTMESVRNKVTRTRIHRDRISRIGNLMRYGNGYQPAVHKWTLVENNVVNWAAELHVWETRVTSQVAGWQPLGMCPVCGGRTETRRCMGTEVYDQEFRCRACVWWHSGYSQGYHEEQIGFVWFEGPDPGAYQASTPGNPTGDDLLAARSEMLSALRDPDFVRMTTNPTGVPIGIVADWLDDHGYSKQAEAAHGYAPVSLLPRRLT